MCKDFWLYDEGKSKMVKRKKNIENEGHRAHKPSKSGECAVCDSFGI